MFRFNRVLFWLWPLALLLFAWVISQLPFTAISHTVGSLSAGQWLAWLMLNALVVATAVGRWQLFSGLLNLPVGFSALLQIRQAGQTVSFITPGPQVGGEPLQLYWLHTRHRAPLAESVKALSLDRFYEVGVNAFVLLSGVSLLAVSPAAGAANWLAIFTALTVIVATVWMGGKALLNQPQCLARWLEQRTPLCWMQAHLQAFNRYFSGFAVQLNQLAQTEKPTLWRALALSLASWAGLLVELWLLMRFAAAPTDFWSFLLVLVAMRLSFLLPLPGGVGTLEAAMFWVFDTLNSPPATAIALIALMRLRDGALLTFGFYCLTALGGRQNAVPSHHTR